MRKLSEYKSHADECRKMATLMKNAEHKKQLQQMAETWDMLAQEREKQLTKTAEKD
ncbi:MAG TPA: hypothetical protein VGH13_17415 [Xanthobacteraceae bacterium]|jgi:hypothetical protein